ncbi:Sirt7, partial [Symbiodinium sp. CCMP2456]
GSWHGLPFWHGRLGRGKNWAAPRLVAEADSEARPGFSSCSADEWEDTPEVLAVKAATLARLLRQSSYTVAYTGAGISTAAGIKDYASRASDSKVKALLSAQGGEDTPLEEGLHAEPTECHRILTSFYKRKLLAHWVQQNHDGLPQKAGLPQEAINEIHGSWFDPSNPVVQFRAELRGDLFAWLLEAEIRAQLVIAVGTSLCDTPSTADRLVVTAAARAAETPATALGAVVVGLQRTRLDQHVQLRVFAEADRFFDLVAKALRDPSPLPSTAAEQSHWAEEHLSEQSTEVGSLLYLTAGPSEGRAVRVARLQDGHVELDCGLRLGSWWLSAAPHSARFPLSGTARVRPARCRRAVEAARLIELPVRANTSPPATFLTGVWCGDAVLLDSRRSEHPTAQPDRAQDLRWVLSAVSVGGEIMGAGFTTWPAANVLDSSGGKVWFTIRGNYCAEGGTIQLTITWEAGSGSQPSSEMSETPGPQNQIHGRVWFDDRRGSLVLAGQWQDQQGDSGAILMTQAQDSCRLFPKASASFWEGTVDGHQQSWVLAMDADGCPSAFGAARLGPDGNPSQGLRLLRGIVQSTEEDAMIVVLREGVGPGSGQRELRVVKTDNSFSMMSAGEGGVHLQHAATYVPTDAAAELSGSYSHSRGGIVHVTVEADEVVLQNSQAKSSQKSPAGTACQNGQIRLHKQLGRRAACGRIDWSNGSVWTPLA